MQFAYQFPQLVDRLILVSAGGVTKDVNIVFRLASFAHGQRGCNCYGCRWCCRQCKSPGGSWVRPSVPPAWGTTCPMCCAFWTTCQSRRLLRRSAAPLRAVGGLAGADGHHAGPMLFDQKPSSTDHLGLRCRAPVRHAHGACRHAGSGGDFEGSGHFPFHFALHRHRGASHGSTEPADTTRPRYRVKARRGVAGNRHRQIAPRVAVLGGSTNAALPDHHRVC